MKKVPSIWSIIYVQSSYLLSFFVFRVRPAYIFCSVDCLVHFSNTYYIFELHLLRLS